jgi:hypothetical protein
MAGIKGKSGAKKGQGRGTINNPSGRPVGATNKVSASLKNLLADFSRDKFEQFKEDYNSITDVYQRAKMYVEIQKFFIPRPLNEEETQSHQLKNEMIKRMIGE